MTTQLRRISHMPKSKNEWGDIINFLGKEECVGIRMKLCISCGFGKLYDKQGKEIKVTRYDTLDRVMEIVNMIKAQD